MLSERSAVQLIYARRSTTTATQGFGAFELRYVRDKNKREVDFLVIRDEKPWMLVEVKRAERSLSPALHYFQQQTGARRAFQVVLDMPYVVERNGNAWHEREYRAGETVSLKAPQLSFAVDELYAGIEIDAP